MTRLTGLRIVEVTMKKHLHVGWVIAVALASIMLTLPAVAQDVPPYLSHQGRLFNDANETLSGPQTLTFRVYDATDDTGSVLWTETVELTLSNGYYSVILGQVTAVPVELFDGSTRYLGVTVGDDTVIDELTPRLEMSSVAYALKSSVAENATGALTPDSVSLNGGNTTLNSDGSVTVGDATIGADGTISLGAATVNVDGSIVVGNTTIGADGTIAVGGNDVISADGAINSSSISGTTLADLEGAGCTTTQVPQYDATNGWSCFTIPPGAAYFAGAGLALDGTTSTFSADTSALQSRVSGACNPSEFIASVNEDGSVNCASVDGSAGIDITNAGTSNTISIDFGVAQRRVSGACSSVQKITGVNEDGSVRCESDVDTNSTYTGADFALSGQGCSVNEVVTAIAADGSVTCTTDADTNTTYSGADFALSGQGCSANEVVTAIAADGSVTCAADADTNTTYSGADFALSGQGCSPGDVIAAIAADGTITCATDQDTQLSEANVEAFITNGAINLNAATTVGSAMISTGAHTVFPTGMISMFDVACPAGWSPYAALNGRIPRGEVTGDPASLDTGGSDDAVVVAHDHAVSGNAASAGAHAHTYSGTSTDSDANHNHAVNLTSTSEGSHAHTVTDPGHGHGLQSHNDDFNCSGDSIPSDGTFGIARCADNGRHNWASNNAVALNSSTGLSVNSGGAHAHTVSGDSANTSATHNHTYSGSTASDGAHAHAVSGSASSSGVSGAGQNLPAYAEVVFCRKD